MRDYQRTTKELKFSELSLETLQEFRKYFEKHELGNPEPDIIMCCETVSHRIKYGFFSKIFGGANFAQNTLIFFNSERLFWGTTDLEQQLTIQSARFQEIEIKDFASDLIEDTGIEVFGFINQSLKRVQAFIGLGQEPCAEEFRKVVKLTAVNAKN